MSFLSKAAPVLVCCTVLTACDEPLDFDLRGGLGGFSTASAVQSSTTDRPQPDDRGVLSYPTYQVVVARRNDTVEDVANRVGVDAAELARFNGIDPAAVLRSGEIIALPRRVAEPAPGTPGAIDITTLAGVAIDSAPDTTPSAAPVQTSQLPPAQSAPHADIGKEPIRHKVERGETAYTIARLYQVPVRSLAEWNGLGPDFAIREGQYLLIPVAAAIPPRRTAATATAAIPQPGSGSPTPTPPSAVTALPNDETVAAAAAAATKPVANVGTPTRIAAPDARMALPVKGRIIRDYAKGRNDGIDIAADPGSPVRAAADGSVAAITSDADQVPIIVIRHPDNLLTVYANVDGIKVNKGDTVKRGQSIARLRSGSDSYVHFEVRDGFDSVDPNPYLN